MMIPPDEDAGGVAVDLDVLRQATGGDRDLMQELAELYVSDADLQLRALGDALQSNELDRIRRIGHTLTGSSAAIGAIQAAVIFRAMETAATEGDTDTIRDAIAQGVAEFVRIRRALADLR